MCMESGFFFNISKRDFTFIREMRVPELGLLYPPLSVRLFVRHTSNLNLNTFSKEITKKYK